LKISPFSTIMAPDQVQLTDSILAAPLATSGAVLTVGPGQQYSSIEAAVQAAQSGDTIQVQAGTYTDDFVTIRESLTLQAVGGMVKMVETGSPPNGKAMIVEGASGISVTIDGFDIGGVAVPDANGAAVRYEGGALTLNNDYFHDNQDGLLAAADSAGTIQIDHSEFAYNGIGDGYTHNVYVGEIAALTITNSYVHDANAGHEIKSRAQNTTITGSRIFDNNSTASYSIEIANAGNATISNNSIEQGPNTSNPIMIWYGFEGVGTENTGTNVSIDNNTIVNDKTGSAVGVYNTATNTIEMSGNQVYGLTSDQLSSGPVAASNTTYLATRPNLDTTSFQTVCFARDTRILTPRGEVAVQDLVEGEPIATHTGEPRPLKWLGFRHLDLTRHRHPDHVAPVRISRDAIAAGQPRRDLYVSPDHCLFLDDKLIPAKLLINDTTIRQERDATAVTYYHVELDRHAVLLAEGLPVESYLDTGNRAFFANAGLALVLHPEFQVNAALRQWATDACAPLTVSPQEVEPVWRRLAARAAELGHVRPQRASTGDAALRLVAQDRTFRPLATRDGRHVFALPAGIQSVRLVSRATVPSHARPWLDEWRRLGVAVRRIAVRSAGECVVLAPDDPNLAEGWHAVERDTAAMWRWTDGDAAILLPRSEAPAIMEIEVAISLDYPVEDAGPEASRIAA